MKKIGIIGRGFVGNRLVKQFANKCLIISYDIKDNVEYPAEELSNCDFVMVCVDTPPSENGSVDINNVEMAISKIPNNKVLLRSTVPPGTTSYLSKKYDKHICFSPEYVGESYFLSSSWRNYEKKRPFFIIGGEPSDCQLFRDEIEYLFGPEITIMQMKAAEAELVKYMENSYFALKISFVNEYRFLAEHLNLNWNSVREGWLLDPRVERDHTSAFKDAPGYSGKCLPKDVNGIISFADESGFDMSIMKAVKKFNDSLTDLNKSFEK